VTGERTTLAERYVLQEPIAHGGMATVWRARDEVLARDVAVKVLLDSLASDESFVRRFRREALAAARLTHPNIVAIYDSGADANDDGTLHYIVMELCAGGSLAQAVDRGGLLPPDKAVSVVCTICDALAYAHREGVVHRDIKPANVLMAEDGTVKVADFGIAKAAFAAGDLTTTGSILGTVTYMAPEQVIGLEPDARSDVYSLGVLAYELLSGRPPFGGDSQLAVAVAHQHEPPPPLRSRRAGIPRHVESAVMRALAKHPAERHGSADEFRVALGDPSERSRPAMQETLQRPRFEPTPSEPAGPDVSEYRKLIPVIVFVVLAVAAAFALPAVLPDGESASGQRTQDSEEGARDSGAQDGPEQLAVRGIRDFDPHGGDGEHPEDAELAIDGRAETAWTTSDYEISLADLGKPGVGLLLDLGRAEPVSAVQITSSTPGYGLEVRSGNSEPADESDLELVDALASAPEAVDLPVDEVSGRFWLVWITSLPGEGGGNVSIAEVRLLGG
jgi:serine/threonine protein kinase